MSLPEPSFIDRDPQAITAEIVAQYEQLTGKTLYPAQVERLLIDVIKGRLTHFMRRDELEAAWAWCDPILDGWKQLNEKPKAYTAGSWGPAASSALMAREGYKVRRVQ